jgi:hypothetical protein
MKNILIITLFACLILFSACTKTVETPTPVVTSTPEPTNVVVKPGSVCTTDYVPVCGEDGRTYANKCLAGDVKILMEKECYESHICTSADKQQTACTREYMPVCGDNGITYDNRCTACVSGNIRMWTSGMCKQSNGTPSNFH